MNCSKFDLKGYFLNELAESERRLVSEHLPGCPDCREELDRLQVTGAALLAVPDEEIPRRIAFVSDKVFEPSWWRRLWASGPRLGFASAAMLTAAILVHAFVAAPGEAPAPAVDRAAVEQAVRQEVSRRLDEAIGAAVERAVADAEARNARQTAELLAAAEERFELQRREDRLIMSSHLEALQKRLNVFDQASAYLASAYQGGPR